MKNINKKFLLLWSAQYISLLGTNMRGFALGLYIFEDTQSVILYSLFPFFTIMPQILLAPFFGVLVDRWNRKTALIIGHSGAGLFTIVLMGMFFKENYSIPVTLCLIACCSVFKGFTYPAFTSVITQIVPTEKLSRVSGMQPLGFALVIIVAPALGGILLVSTGIKAIFLIESATFIMAILLIATIRIPSLNIKKNSTSKLESFIIDLKTGITHLKEQPILLYTLFLESLAHFNTGIIQVLITPLVLGIADQDTVGIMWSVAGFGLLAGSLTLLLLKGIRRRTQKMILLCTLQGFILLLVFFKTSLLFLGIGSFFFMLATGLIGGINTALWQKEIPQDLQGRAFGIKTLAKGSTILIGYIFSGPLIDKFFQPILSKDILLVHNLSKVMGKTPTPEIVILLFFLGFLTIFLVSILYFRIKHRHKTILYNN